LIVGAGIAGLALAAALRRRGRCVDIVERAAEPPASGAGLYLLGGTTRALRVLGLGDAFVAAGQIIDTQTFFNHRGHRLAEIDVGRYWADCGPCLGVTHTALHRALAEKAGTDVRFGFNVQSLTQNDEQVSVRFGDGSTASYDFVIGADGIRSSVRQLAFGGSQPRYRGQTGWRFLVHRAVGVDGWTVFLGADRAFLVVPVGAECAYCYADHVVDLQSEHPPDRHIEYLKDLFDDFPQPVRKVLDSLDVTNRIHCAPIEEVAYQPLGQGRIALIGDAAHAMSPNMACGVMLALEDSLVLSDVLCEDLTVSRVVPEFARRRSTRIEWTRLQTEKRDRMRSLPALIRDLSLRLFMTQIYHANYRPLLVPV